MSLGEARASSLFTILGGVGNRTLGETARVESGYEISRIGLHRRNATFTVRTMACGCAKVGKGMADAT